MLYSSTDYLSHPFNCVKKDLHFFMCALLAFLNAYASNFDFQRKRPEDQEEAGMKCLICEYGETEPGTTTVTLTRGETTIVIREVPAQIRSICGEEYVDAATGE